MEDTNNINIDFKYLVDILSQGEEESRQLELVLNEQAQLYAKSLVHKLQSTLRKATEVARYFEAIRTRDKVAASDSPRGSESAEFGSPRSEGSERKKRKSLPRWTTKIQVPNFNNGSSDQSVQAPEDGYSWRKYGQKEILGARCPRAYYRCTHQKSQQCLATKQVQRSDEDSTIFNITYLGNHSCMQHAGQTSTTLRQTQTQTQQHEPNQQVLIQFNSAPTDNQGTTTHSSNSIPFSIDQGNQAIFSPPNSSFGGGFIVPDGTSNSTFVPPFQSQYGDYGEYLDFPGRESDLSEIVSFSRSTYNDFETQMPDVEPEFRFDPMSPFK